MGRPSARMLAGDGPPAAPRALQCEALEEEACHAPICTTGDRVQRVRLVTAHRPRPEAERSRLVTTERALLASCVTTRSCCTETQLFASEGSSPLSIAIYLPRRIRCLSSQKVARRNGSVRWCAPRADLRASPRSARSSRLVRRRTATAACVSKRHASDSISSGRRGEQH